MASIRGSLIASFQMASMEILHKKYYVAVRHGGSPTGTSDYNQMNKFREKLIELKSKQSFLSSQIAEKTIVIENLRISIDTDKKCRQIVNDLAQTTISNLIRWLEITVSKCIGQVYSGYSFRFDQQIKRNQMELHPLIVDSDGRETPPDYSVGGGMLDLISVALRVAVWAIQDEKTLPVFILDEPMKFMGELSEQGAQVIEQLSEKMGLQFIIITHNQDFIGGFKSVKRFEITNKKGQSHVEVIVT